MINLVHDCQPAAGIKTDPAVVAEAANLTNEWRQVHLYHHRWRCPTCGRRWRIYGDVSRGDQGQLLFNGYSE